MGSRNRPRNRAIYAAVCFAVNDPPVLLFCSCLVWPLVSIPFDTGEPFPGQKTRERLRGALCVSRKGSFGSFDCHNLRFFSPIVRILWFMCFRVHLKGRQLLTDFNFQFPVFGVHGVCVQFGL